MKSLFKSVVILSVFSIITKLMGFGFKLILTRVMSTELLGMYTIAFSVLMVFITIISSGLPLSISKITSKNNTTNNNSNTHSVISAGVIISLILAIVTTLAVLILKPAFDFIFTSKTSYTMLLTMLPCVVSTALYAPFRGYLWGNEKYVLVSLVELIEQTIRIAVTIILFFIFKNLNPMLPAGLGLSIACIVSSIVGVIFYFKSGGRLNNPKHQYKQILKSSTPITLIRLVSSVLTPIISIILPLRLISVGYSNSQAMSLIGIVMGMTVALLFTPSAIIGSLATAIIPSISSLQYDKCTQKLNNQIKTSLNFTLCSCILFVPIFIALGEEICVILFNNALSGVYLSKYAWILIPIGLSQITNSILNALSKETTTFVHFIISSILLILCVIFLPQIVGIHAFLIGLGLSHVMLFVLNIITINKVTSINTLFIKKPLVYLLISLPISYMGKMLNNLLVVIFPQVISVFLSCMIVALCLFLLLVAFNQLDMEYIKLAIKKVKPKYYKTLNK